MPTVTPKLHPIAIMQLPRLTSYVYGCLDDEGIPIPLLSLDVPKDEITPARCTQVPGETHIVDPARSKESAGVYCELLSLSGSVSAVICENVPTGREYMLRALKGLFDVNRHKVYADSIEVDPDYQCWLVGVDFK